MDAPIPLKGVVLFIAFGTMIFIIVFCFVKRQITRFTLRSSHGPHAVIGSGAPKLLSQEIERRLRRVKDILHEPRLLNPESEEKWMSDAATSNDSPHFVYRMKAVDGLALLDEEMRKCKPGLVRSSSIQLKSYLLEQRLNGPLEGCKLELIDKFSTCYDHARHDPKVFTQADYQQFMDLLNHLISHLRLRSHSCYYRDSSVLRPSTTTSIQTTNDLVRLDSID